MRRATCWILQLAALAGLVGCGGSSPSSTVAPKPLPGTAKFHIDVASGQVSITPSTTGSRAILLGGSAGFTTSTLLDQPGNTGLRILNVAVSNGWVQDIGRQPDGVVTGLRVLFSPFVTAQAFADLRPKVTVSALVASATDDSVDGPLATAAMRAPTGAAVGPDGSIYITDAAANRVRKIRAGFVSTLAGSGTGGPGDGLGTAAQLAQPAGIAINPRDGALIVTELSGHRVRRITPEGRVTTIAGGTTSGGANGLGNVATFTNPFGAAVAADGTIYVVERNGHRVRRIVQSGADPTLPGSYTVSTLAGSGAPGLRDGVGAEAQFSFASGLTIGPDGRLYVADTGNHRIRLVSPDGAVVTIAGAGPQTSLDGDGAVATFNQPIGVVWAGQALIVTEDAGRVIRQVSLRAGGTASPANPRSWSVQTLAGNPASSTVVLNGDGTAATFAGLRLPAVDARGTLVVPEATNRAIRLVTPPNGLFPVGTVSGAGDGSLVRLASADGVIPNSLFGANLPFVSYTGVVAPGGSTAAKPWVFAVPAGVAAFEFMVTVEADTAVAAPPEAVVNASAGVRVVGSPNVRVRTYAGGDAGLLDGDVGLARFGAIHGLARDAQGRLYVTDGNNRVRCVEPNGRVYTIAGSTLPATIAEVPVDGPGNTAQLAQPRGIAVSADGDAVYVAELGRSRIRLVTLTGPDRFNSANWTVTSVAGGALFNAAQNGTVKGDKASFGGVSGLLLATADDLYVCEPLGNRVRRVRFVGGDRRVAANWEVSLVAGDASLREGAPGDTDGLGAAARFSQPQGLAMDRSGLLYVAEASASRIRRIDNAGGLPGAARVSFWAGAPTVTASARFSLADGTSATARFSSPVGLGIDAAGYVYVCDYQNRRIRRIGPNAEVATVAGSGTANAVFDGLTDGTNNTVFFGENQDGTGATAQFGQARCLLVDPSGSIYVGDGTRLRLIERTVSPAPT
ncbi:MAG: hypothetical protein HZB16_08065 [Armatimonadetes bacterium]|nr:hypothetical protein [Armatimonadota bacterium]